MLTLFASLNLKLRALSSQWDQKWGILQVLVTLFIFGHFKNVQFQKKNLTMEKNSDCDWQTIRIFGVQHILLRKWCKCVFLGVVRVFWMCCKTLHFYGVRLFSAHRIITHFSFCHSFLVLIVWLNLSQRLNECFERPTPSVFELYHIPLCHAYTWHSAHCTVHFNRSLSCCLSTMVTCEMFFMIFP